MGSQLKSQLRYKEQVNSDPSERNSQENPVRT